MSGGEQEFWPTHFYPGDSKFKYEVSGSLFNKTFLCRLARKYLSVQATSTSAERVMSEMGIVLQKNRQRMTGELFNEIMFLSDADLK